MLAGQKHREILGEMIRTKRKKSDLSQEKLAERANLSTVFISRVERGKESPSVDSLLKIAKALGVKVHDLVRGF
jgi:transcriptional regulator with XRE-family HTH domain